jgi:antitoxin VapB
VTINLRNPRTDELIRKLAETRGIGLTEAVHEAVEEALKRDGLADPNPGETLLERLRPLHEKMRKYKRTGEVADKKFFDELWGQGDDN